MNELRGTGRTTRQMQEAPKKAVYVWPNQTFSWPKEIAVKIERTDLQIVSVSWLKYENIIGKKFSAIILDHAVHLSAEQWENYWRIKQIISDTNVGVKNETP